MTHATATVLKSKVHESPGGWLVVAEPYNFAAQAVLAKPLIIYGLLLFGGSVYSTLYILNGAEVAAAAASTII